MNKIISVSGPSGVGKTTLSKIISICLGHTKSLIVSGDDSHKWERGDENWKFITHLNPAANNIEQEITHLTALKEGTEIHRRLYNHSSGLFSEPTRITPKENIIYEGLHSMYGPLQKVSDLSFYLDVDSELKNEWKISRDSKKRGYTIDQIVKAIENRKADEEQFIKPQKQVCDVVIKFKKQVDGQVDLSFDYSDPALVPLINDIKTLYSKLNSFIKVSRELGKNEILTQNKGGNLSFKFKDVILITESGSSFDKINYFEGFGFYTLDGKSVFEGQKRPSMEIDCHIKMDDCCLHTHPLHALAVLSCRQTKQILDGITKNYQLVGYTTPGHKLSQSLSGHRNTFLKNHGIFISRKTLEECLQDTVEFDNLCKKYLYDSAKTKAYLYPDAVVLEDTNTLYHAYVKQLLRDASLDPEPLSEQLVEELINMEAEKYRKQS
jgi:uridine kinase/ribulose-5-phosphate 4-epimerase/fuculose-1-phosphate aldolase